MKSVFPFLVFFSGVITLFGGGWPEVPTPVWTSMPPEQVLFAASKPVEIPGGGSGRVNPSQTISFKLPAVPAEQLTALQFKAVLLRPNSAGNRYFLAVRLNDSDLRMLTRNGAFRLMNRGEYFPDSWPGGYKKRMGWIHQINYPTLLGLCRPESRAGDALTYVLDVSDVVRAGENSLEIINAGDPGEGQNTLRITDLQVVTIPAAAVAAIRARAPEALSSEEKMAFLLQQFDPALPLTKKLRGISDVHAQMDELLAYFRTRSPRPVTMRGNTLKQGMTPTETDKKFADDALNNKINSLLAGYPAQLYQDKVDFLTNRTPLRNHDWLAQHNRLIYMRSLAACYRTSGDEKYAQSLFKHLDNWCDVAERNYAPGVLPIWDSLNTGIRGRGLSEILDLALASPALTPAELVNYLYLLYLHGDYLYNTRRMAGNWGITEAEGLAFIGIFVPEFTMSKQWAQTGLRQVRDAFKQQINSDGMHIELNWSYHYHSIEWFGNPSQLAVLNQRKDLAEWLIPESGFEKMYEIVGVCLHPDYRNSAWGDAADEKSLGKMRLAFSRFPQNNLFRYLATERKEGTPPENFRYFPGSGFYSVRSGWDADAVHLLARCGPDGGWHCHFDNGTFELFAYGRNLTPDTGNFTYSQTEGRDWYKASARHQTLTLDDKNIAFAPQPLLASSRPDFTAVMFANQSYPNLQHRRAFAFIAGKYVVVFDEARGDAHGDVAIHFQTAPGAPLKIDGATGVVRTLFPEGANLLFTPLAQSGLKVTEEEGKKANQGSWKPRPAFRYSLVKNNDAPVFFATALVPYRGINAPAVQLLKLPNGDFQLTVDQQLFRLRYRPDVPALLLNPAE